MEQYFRVGVLTSEHGLKGEMKVFPTTDDVGKFKRMKRIFIDLSSNKGLSSNEGLCETEVESVKFFKNLVIVKLKEISSVEEAKKFKGMDLLIAREDAEPLKEGEYYIPDIIGCRVIGEENEDYGLIRDVLETGANKVIVVNSEEIQGLPKEFCLPYIPQCVKEINITEKYMKIHLMKGLLD